MEKNFGIYKNIAFKLRLFLMTTHLTSNRKLGTIIMSTKNDKGEK